MFASFSKNARYVLTSSKDFNVCLWDLASDSDPPLRKNVIRFDAPVTNAYFHPRNRSVPSYNHCYITLRQVWPPVRSSWCCSRLEKHILSTCGGVTEGVKSCASQKRRAAMMTDKDLGVHRRRALTLRCYDRN